MTVANSITPLVQTESLILRLVYWLQAKPRFGGALSFLLYCFYALLRLCPERLAVESS
jgi:hypothetical protein